MHGHNPAQVSFFLLEPAADAAMTYFYGQLSPWTPRSGRCSRPPWTSSAGASSAPWSASPLARTTGRLVPYLEQLGRAHRKFGVRDGTTACSAARCWPRCTGSPRTGWDEAAQQAWERAFDHAVDIMIDAAARDAEHAPAWWIATVTAIELRGPDVALLTVAPEQPLRYRPGQYVSVQTPHWPRLWRRYSIANAPRPDGSLRLHVRAVAGAWSAPPWSITSGPGTRWCSARPPAR